MFKKIKSTKRTLKVIIVGCGKVGANLVEQLSKEGNDIVVIDKNPQKIQSITSMYDVMGITGNGASYSLQIEAGIENTDLFIAVTGSDELNLLCCTLAKQVGNCSVIARVRTPDYSSEIGYLQEKLGLTMVINPELETAKEVSRILNMPTALEVNSFAHGQAELIKFKIHENNVLDGLTISNLGNICTTKVLICAIERDNEIYIPSGNFVIKAGDIISFVTSRKNVKPFLCEIGVKANPIKDCMIIGGGKSTYYLASHLIHVGISVKIIETNPTRCEELSDLLPKAVVINADGTDESILKEQGIETVDSFIPLTGIDEENVMLTLYSKKVSSAKVITKINRPNFKSVISQLDLGSVIYPQIITSEAIIAYARAKKNSIGSNIETLYHMFDSKVEAIEFLVEAKSAVTDTPLMKLSLKKNLLISFINRNGSIIIPSGSDCIHVGDTVMIVTKHSGFNNILDILE